MAAGPARPSGDAVGAEDRKLGGGGAGQQIARCDRGLELVCVEPAALIDKPPPQQRDVRRRPAEADQADPPPLPQDGGERENQPPAATASSVGPLRRWLVHSSSTVAPILR